MNLEHTFQEHLTKSLQKVLVSLENALLAEARQSISRSLNTTTGCTSTVSEDTQKQKSLMPLDLEQKTAE